MKDEVTGEALAACGTYRFGDFVLATRPPELRRAGEVVDLQPQPARALAFLVERAGTIVTRDELRRHLWSDDVYLDHEQAINFAVRKIRIALGDEVSAPQFLETLPRRGYRFLAPVESIAEIEDSTEWERLPEPATASEPTLRAAAREAHLGAASPAAGATAQRFGREVRPAAIPRLAIGLLAAGVLTVTALATGTLTTGTLTTRALTTRALTTELIGGRWLDAPAALGTPGAPRGGMSEPLRLAVAPLVALETGVEAEQMTSALSAEMTSELTRRFGAQLPVVTLRLPAEAGASAWAQAVERVRATHVIHGTSTLENDQIRLVLRLERVADDVNLWAQSFESPVDLRFSRYEELARELGAVLAIQDIEPQATLEIPPDIEADYAQARLLLSIPNSPSLLGGIALLREICERHPDMTRAWVDLAAAYRNLSETWLRTYWLEAETAARQALVLDPNNTEARLHLAAALLHGRLDWQGAGRDLAAVIASEPSSSTATRQTALYLSSLGRHDEARALYQRQDASSLHFPPRGLGSPLLEYFARRHESAADAAAEILERYPSHRVALLYGGLSRAALGQEEAALERFREYHDLFRPGPPPTTLAEVYDAFVDEWRQNSNRDRPAHGFLAAWLSMAEQDDLALQHLQQGCDGESDWMMPFVSVNPMFDRLRHLPGYRALASCLEPPTGLAFPPVDGEPSPTP